MSILDAELRNRALLYGSFMQHQFSTLQKLPGFQELPLPPSLARQLSTKLVAPPPILPALHPLPAVKAPDRREILLHGVDLRPLATESATSATWAQAVDSTSAWWGRGESEVEEGSWIAERGGEGRERGKEGETGQEEGRYAMGPRGKVRPLVRSWLFRTEHMRRVRFTYFDGGAAVQAFNSLCYPQDWLDLPLLGIDLLSFGGSKLLCVIDLQPVTSSHVSSARVEAALSSLRARHRDALFQPMTSRFFNDTRFFSPHMLLLRSSLGWSEPLVHAPDGALFEAMDEFLRLYEHLLTSAPVLTCPDARARVRQGQSEYDEYFKRTDPAIPMFSTYCGEEWSNRYADEFLFPWAPLGAAHK